MGDASICVYVCRLSRAEHAYCVRAHVCALLCACVFQLWGRCMKVHGSDNAQDDPSCRLSGQQHDFLDLQDYYYYYLDFDPCCWRVVRAMLVAETHHHLQARPNPTCCPWFFEDAFAIPIQDRFATLVELVK